MPCHSPTKTNEIRSVTMIDPSLATPIVSRKSATRQLRADAGETSVNSMDVKRSSEWIRGDTKWELRDSGLGRILSLDQFDCIVTRTLPLQARGQQLPPQRTGAAGIRTFRPGCLWGMTGSSC